MSDARSSAPATFFERNSSASFPFASFNDHLRAASATDLTPNAKPSEVLKCASAVRACDGMGAFRDDSDRHVHLVSSGARSVAHLNVGSRRSIDQLIANAPRTPKESFAFRDQPFSERIEKCGWRGVIEQSIVSEDRVRLLRFGDCDSVAPHINGRSLLAVHKECPGNQTPTRVGANVMPLF
jgi:hypothetical protein